ncbi:MAG: aminotransferase class I/II-fold pyridoxal phosphate-dependent enzyme [Candidatus Omnitrophica bacterium]|nr:aminotransferase class I/II-fold pyridoxal phosphate-dependent enzyme [Candidatus Omnitrophota bacterium]
MKISRIVEELPPSGIRAFFDLVLGMKDVVSLGVGEPDFVTSWNIREKAIYSLEQGYTSYTSNKGMAELRQEIVRFLKWRFGVEYDFDKEMLITVGVSEGLDLAVRTILNPGEKLMVPRPCYVSYGPLALLAGGEPIYVETEVKEGFKLTPEKILKAYQPGARAIIINYPCNPTGTSYNKKELLAIAKVVEKLDLLVLSDEVYDELTYDFEHTPFVTLPGMKERTIYFNGFSKAYAMTGFRLGWAAGPEKLIAGMTKIHQYTMLCAPITSQLAAIEAMKNGGAEVQAMKKEYNRRRNYIIASLNELGLKCHVPQGAFYAFPSIKSTGMSSMNFAKDLLEKEKVALVPGTAFSPHGEGFVRISYASSYDNLREAVTRIGRYLKGKRKLQRQR